VATTARFGRLPRSAPNLTAAIVAAAREYQNMRERNIRDAWQNGGDFEGKKVTDEMLIAFFKEKLKGLSSDDPTANETRNTLVQYEFAIANSKMELKYAQKKATDAQMAAFYTEWAGKLPTDSEAYRERARLAAGYRDRAIAAARSGGGGGRGGGRSKDDAYYDRQTDLYNRTGGAYDSLMGYVNGLAQSGIIGVSAPVLGVEGETVADLRADEYDATNLQTLLRIVATDPTYATWRAETTAAIRRIDPSFNGRFDYESITALGKRKSAGLDALADAAKAAGKKGDYKAYLKAKAEHTNESVKFATLDEMSAYEQSRVDWMKVISDPDATLSEKKEATDAYGSTLESLARRAQADGDNIRAGRFNSELLATRGEKVNTATLWEESRGTTQAGGGEGGDAASTAASVIYLNENLSKLTAVDPTTGRPLFAQVRLDKNGIPTSGNGDWGVVPISALEPGSVAFVKAGGDGKASIVTAVVGVPVRVVGVIEDQYGVPASSFGTPGGVQVGTRFNMPDGSSAWSYTDSAGETRYTTTNPFLGPSANQTRDGDEIVWRSPLPGAGQPQLPDRFSPSSFVDPDKYNPDTADRMPNDVFLSLPAAEMALNPKDSYWKYTPAQLRTIATTQSGGDPAKAQRIYGELDEQRAAFIRDPKAPWDTRLRLAAANRNGDLPLITDGYGQGPSVGGLNAPTVPLGALSKESQAAYEKIAGRTDQQIVNATAQDILKKWGLGAITIPGQHPNDWKAKGTASVTAPPRPQLGPPAPILPNESREMSNNLISGIWQNVFGTGSTSTQPSRLPMGTVPRPAPAKPQAGPPAPSAPPKPTVPKPFQPPKPAPAPVRPTPGLTKPPPGISGPRPLTAQQQKAVAGMGTAFGSTASSLARFALQYGVKTTPPKRGVGGGGKW
jgi:hypothetical protein